MRKSLSAVLVGAVLATPVAALAQAKSPHSFSGNVGLVSDYIFRGISQTRGKPALQGGFDYAHASGFYAGLWGSNVSWIADGTAGASNSLEVDLYGGYKGTISGDLGFDVGVLTYNYPGTGLPTGPADPDTTELYGGLSYKWFSAKYSRTTGSAFGWTKTVGATKTKGSGYLDLTGSIEIGSGLNLVAHVGRQKINGRGSASYSDWKLGLSKEFDFGTLGIAVTDTNARANCANGDDYCFVHAGSATDTYDAGKSRVILSFAKTF